MLTNFDKDLDCYIDNYKSTILAETKDIIRIPSVSESKEVIYALNYALDLFDKYGFKTQNYKNIIGIADIDNEHEKTLGIIGHVDVGPAGEGWDYNPFELNIDKGHYFGRGVLDDKGPIVLMVHAIDFLNKQNIRFNHNVRFLIGTCEETSSYDIETYLNNFKEPDFVIVPDGEFPICYGEKGILRFRLCFKDFISRGIIDVSAGKESNVIPEKASAILPIKMILASDNIKVQNIKTKVEKNTIQITAKGKAAHATEINSGINAIYFLNKFLIEKTLISNNNKEILKYINSFTKHPDGSHIGLRSYDKDFGFLTIAPTMMKIKDNDLYVNFDCRYPTTISWNKIIETVKNNSPTNCVEIIDDKKDPYMIPKNSPLVKSCTFAFEYVTKNKARRFTMAGSTYAKNFKNAMNFGPVNPFYKNPNWLGSLHEANEGISEEDFWTTFKIYVHALHDFLK